MGRALDRGLKQRACDSLLDCFERLVVALGLADTDMRHSLVLHDRLYIGKVEIDQSRQIDQIGDTLDSLLKNLICFLQCFRHRRSAVYDLKKLIVRDHDQCIHILLKALNAGQRICHPDSRFKTEGFGHDTDGEDTHFLCDPGYDRRSSRSGSAAHTTGNEYHIRSLDSLPDLFRTLLGSLLADLRLCSGTKALGHFLTDLDRHGCLAHGQCLFIRIDTDKLHSADGVLHHTVDCIVTGSSYSYNDDPCGRLGFIRHDL